MKNEITKIQEIQLQLIIEGSFNSMSGDKIVDDLKKNKELWISVQGLPRQDLFLITLRDMPDDIWNICMLYIFTEKKNIDALLKLGRRWFSCDIKIIQGQKFGGPINKAMGTGGYNKDKAIVIFYWD